MIFTKLRAFFEWMGQKALAKSRRSLDYKWTTYRSETPRQDPSDAPAAAHRPADKASVGAASRAQSPAEVPEQDLTPSIQINVDELFEKEKKPAAAKTTRRKAAAKSSEAPAADKKTAAKRTTAAGSRTRKSSAAAAKTQDSTPAQAELALTDEPAPPAVKKTARKPAAKKTTEDAPKRIGRPPRVKPVDEPPPEPKKRGRRPKPPGQLTERQIIECQQMFEGRTGTSLVELLVVDFPELAGIRNKRQLLTHLKKSEPMFRKLKKAIAHSYHSAHREKLAEQVRATSRAKKAAAREQKLAQARKTQSSAAEESQPATEQEPQA